MYFVPPRYNPVGASDPGSAKSFIMPVISSGLNYIKINILPEVKYRKSTKIECIQRMSNHITTLQPMQLFTKAVTTSSQLSLFNIWRHLKPNYEVKWPFLLAKIVDPNFISKGNSKATKDRLVFINLYKHQAPKTNYIPAYILHTYMPTHTDKHIIADWSKPTHNITRSGQKQALKKKLQKAISFFSFSDPR